MADLNKGIFSIGEFLVFRLLTVLRVINWSLRYPGASPDMHLKANTLLFIIIIIIIIINIIIHNERIHMKENF